MKKCIFRKNIYGFGDWCNQVRRISNIYYSYSCCDSKQKNSYYKSYKEQLKEYKIIIEFKKQLPETYLFVFENFLTRHHVVPKEVPFSMKDYYKMYELWITLRFEISKVTKIVRYSSLELGKMIKAARVYDGRTRIEVAQILEISENSLKQYEEGLRMVPSDVLLMLNQLYGEKIVFEKAFPKNPLKIMSTN